MIREVTFSKRIWCKGMVSWYDHDILVISWSFFGGWWICSILFIFVLGSIYSGIDCALVGWQTSFLEILTIHQNWGTFVLDLPNKGTRQWSFLLAIRIASDATDAFSEMQEVSFFCPWSSLLFCLLIYGVSRHAPRGLEMASNYELLTDSQASMILLWCFFNLIYWTHM